jgi:DNA-directed RNA polymerase subunit K/omega
MEQSDFSSDQHRVHIGAQEALRRQLDRDAIAEGLTQMEQGQGKPLDQAFSEMRSRLNDLRIKDESTDALEL